MGKYDDLMAQYKKERQSKGVEAMPSPLKGMLSTANAATLGLGGQLYALGGGAIEAAKGGEFSEGYKEQVAAASNPLASASSRIAAAKNALFFAQKVKQKYGNYASKILSGEVTPDELKTESSKPTRSKEELFQLKKEYESNRKKYKDDPEAIKILDNEARLDGLIK